MGEMRNTWSWWGNLEGDLSYCPGEEGIIISMKWTLKELDERVNLAQDRDRWQS
jgi:hypothetical protein